MVLFIDMRFCKRARLVPRPGGSRRERWIGLNIICFQANDLTVIFLSKKRLESK